MSLMRKHRAVLQAWACLAFVIQTNTNTAMHRCPYCKRRTINYCYDDDDDDDYEAVVASTTFVAFVALRTLHALRWMETTL